MEQLPSNSHRQSKAEEPKKIERVVKGEVSTRKKPITRRISESFFANRADMVGEYIFWDVFIPAAKDTIVDMTTSFVNRMMFGESVSGRGRAGLGVGRGPSVGSFSNDRVAYNRVGNPLGVVRDQPEMSRRGRARHDFREIIIPTRVEAEGVLDQLFKLILEYNAVTVADLYSMCGITPNFTDDKYGWMDIRGAGVIRVNGGFVLDLPAPQPLD